MDTCWYENTKKHLDAAGIQFSGGYVYGVAESVQELRDAIIKVDTEQ